MRTGKHCTCLVSPFSFELVKTSDTYLFTSLVIQSFPWYQTTQIAGSPTDDLHFTPARQREDRTPLVRMNL